MFNDKFGLTQAVLEGRKTMTRRIIKCPRTFRGEWVAGFNIHRSPSDKKIVGFPCMYDADEREFDMGEILPKYELGEVVAIAQSYKDIGYNGEYSWVQDEIHYHRDRAAGWANKMFVKVNLMPHHIEITGIKVERLQDISDEDCLKEGIIHAYTDNNGIKIYHTPHTKRGYLSTDVAQQAFSFLIDKVSGKGTWESNPFVFAYEFVLVD